MSRAKKIPAGEFKAKCLQLMDRVQQKHYSYTITKRGKPVAKLVPVVEEPTPVYGCMKDSCTIKGDIISPIDEEWDADK